MGLKFWWQEQSIRKFVECHRARDLVLSTLALHCIVVCKVSQSKVLGPLYITRTCLSCSSLRRAKINHFQEEELKFVT